jgi:hypothetical protein
MDNTRLCGCGAMLLASNPSLVCCFECLAAEYGGSLPRSDIKLGYISETARAKLAAQAKAQAEGFNAIVHPSPVVTDFPSKYVQIVRHWEKQDASLIDPATLPLEGEDGATGDFYPKAVSQAQVFWARGELAKAKRGGYVKLSLPELEALANTPLAGLPERAERKKPAKQGRPKAKAPKTKAILKKAKEA